MVEVIPKWHWIFLRLSVNYYYYYPELRFQLFSGRSSAVSISPTKVGAAMGRDSRFLQTSVYFEIVYSCNL